MESKIEETIPSKYFELQRLRSPGILFLIKSPHTFEFFVFKKPINQGGTFLIYLQLNEVNLQLQP
mgnify:FL=1